MIDGLSEWFIFAIMAMCVGAVSGRFLGYLSGKEYLITVCIAGFLILIKIIIGTPIAMIGSLLLAAVLLIVSGRKVMMSVAMAGNGVFLLIIVPENMDKLNWFN